jgi:hypothetical protein
MASKDGGSLLKVEFSHRPREPAVRGPRQVRWRNLAFLIEHDWKAKPVRFDVGRKLVKLVVGEHRTQRGGLMDDRRGGPPPLRRCGQRAFEHEGAAMSANQPAADNKKVTTVVGTLKRIGGSRSDHWNNVLINQAARTLWIKHSEDTGSAVQRDRGSAYWRRTERRARRNDRRSAARRAQCRYGMLSELCSANRPSRGDART